MNFPTEIAVRIREAINDTIRQLQPAVMSPGLPEAARTALQTHLEALLKEELRTLTGQALMADFTEKFAAYIDPRKDSEPPPWYPDDSGEWVEGHPRDLPPNTPMAGWLFHQERENKTYTTPESGWLACELHNPDIVAYKVVKP